MSEWYSFCDSHQKDLVNLDKFDSITLCGQGILFSNLEHSHKVFFRNEKEASDSFEALKKWMSEAC